MGDGAIKVMGSGADPQKNLASNVLKTQGVFVSKSATPMADYFKNMYVRFG